MRKVFPCHYIFWHSYRRTWFVIQEEPCLSPTILSWNPHLLSGPIPEDMCVGGPSSTLGVTASASLDWFTINSWVQGLMLDVTKTVGTSGCSKFTLMQILLPPGLSQALPLLSRVWAPSIASKLTRDWPATPVHPTSTGKTLHPHLVSSHSCCRSEYLAIFRLLAQLMLPSKRLWALRLWLNILDLSLAQSKLKLCSANHRPGYWSNLPCDWPSTAWAYSEQEAENRPWSGQVMWQQCGLGRQGDDLGQPSSSRPLYLRPVTILFLADCWGFPPAATNWISWTSASWIWVLHCLCTASAITFRTWLCHQVYFDSDATQIDRMCTRVPCFPHWLYWIESGTFQSKRLTGVAWVS